MISDFDECRWRPCKSQLFARRAFPALLVALLVVDIPASRQASAGVILLIDQALDEVLNQTDVDGDLRLIVSSSVKNGRYAEAIERLTVLKNASPNDSRVWFALAVSQLGDHRIAEALASAERCVKLRPEWEVAYWLKGAVLVADGKLNRADEAFDEAVRIAPQHAGVYYQRGAFRVVYRSSDLAILASGIVDLQKALELKASPEIVDGMLGKAYVKQRKIALAEQHLRRAFEFSATELNVDALADLVSLYDSTGRSSKAEGVLAEAERRRQLMPVELSALHGGYYLIVARHLVAVRRAPQEITAAFDRAITLHPRNASYRLEYARWLDGMERTREEISVLRQGLASPPYDPELAAQLAWALAESGQNLEEARRWLKQALVGDPKSQYLADTAAWIEYREGNYRAALVAIQPSLGLIQEIPEVAYHAGAIQAELGNKAEALRYLKIALKSGISFPGASRAKELMAQLQR